jgi:hypothetical protein
MHMLIQTEGAWRGAPRYILTGVWTPCYPAVDSGAPTSGMSMWKSAGCSCRHSDGLGFLGDSSTLTAAQAMQAAIQQSSGLKLNPRDFQNSSWLTKAESQIAAGAFDVGWYSPSCASQPASNMNLLAVGGGIALSAAGAAEGIMVATHVISAVTGAIAGAATMGVGVLISVIAMIFEHHAAAVRRDLSFGCGALPAVNNSFAVINQAVRAGQTTPTAAAQALDHIYSQYQSSGGAAINDNPWCNSNCEMGVILKGMVLYWQSQYAAMAASAAASSTDTASNLQSQAIALQQEAAAAQAKGDTATANALSAQANVLQQQAARSAASSGGLPPFALIAAGLVGLFFFLK